MLKNGDIARIIKINTQNTFEIRRFMIREPYFQYPLDSTKVHIYLIRRISSETEIIDHSKIFRKCVALPIDARNELVCFPHNSLL